MGEINWKQIGIGVASVIAAAPFILWLAKMWLFFINQLIEWDVWK